MKEELQLISDAIAAETKAIRYTCGLSRHYIMATLDAELMEARAFLLQKKEASVKELQELLDNVNEAIEQSITNHALMASNRPPKTGTPECEVICPGFRYSGLSYADTSAQKTEQHLCSELLKITCSEEIPDFPVNHTPFPLCELAVTLANEIRQLCQQRLSKLQEHQHCIQLDEKNPKLLEYMTRTIEVGLMTPTGQWEENVTRAQKAYWIGLAAERLHIAHQWKWARDRWGIENLAQDQSKNLCGQFIPHRRVIDQIFG